MAARWVRTLPLPGRGWKTSGEQAMNLVLWLVVGVVATLLANIKPHEVPRQRLVIEWVFSELGALVAGAAAVPKALWLDGGVDVPGLAAACAGAAAMLVVAHLHEFRDGRP